MVWEGVGGMGGIGYEVGAVWDGWRWSYMVVACGCMGVGGGGEVYRCGR